jgi:hypothetical protein
MLLRCDDHTKAPPRINSITLHMPPGQTKIIGQVQASAASAHARFS